ncbi:MAG: hypothetical protein ACK5LK_01400 [Chthoniobacterales bacterium]
MTTPYHRGENIHMLRAELSLVEKIEMIQRHIEQNHFGNSQIPACMLHDGGISGKARRWEAKDFEGQSIRNFRCNRPSEPPIITPADWLNNENSTMFCGEYLVSQVERYRVTKNQDALKECERAFWGIKAVAELSGRKNFGWLSKPFGEKVSPESSPDQNLCAVAGLWAFLPYANTEQAKWIRQIIPAIAAYWERISYTIDFGDHVWDIREDDAHVRIFWLINLLAYELVKDEQFQKVAERLERRYGDLKPENASLFDAFQKNDVTYFKNWRLAGEFAGATLLFVPLTLSILCEIRPEGKEIYLRTYRRALERGLIGLDPDFLGHYYQHEVKADGEEYVWRPVETRTPNTAERKQMCAGEWGVHMYPHRAYWMDATSRLPVAYLNYLHCGGEPVSRIERIVRGIMKRLDFQRIHWMLDPYRDQLVSELDYMRHALTSEIANYVSAFWLGKSLGFWREEDLNMERSL